eukprot:Opistho-2@47414
MRLEAAALRADRSAQSMRSVEEKRKEMELRLVHHPKVTRTVKALAKRNERSIEAESDLRDEMLVEFRALGAEKIREIEEFKVEGERTDPQLRSINARFAREVKRFDACMRSLGGLPSEEEESMLLHAETENNNNNNNSTPGTAPAPPVDAPAAATTTAAVRAGEGLETIKEGTSEAAVAALGGGDGNATVGVTTSATAVEGVASAAANMHAH